jgi:hypothetical protein
MMIMGIKEKNREMEEKAVFGEVLAPKKKSRRDSHNRPESKV